MRLYPYFPLPCQAKFRKHSGARITGMRSWSGRTRSLASVVIIVHDSIADGPVLPNLSHKPAKAKGLSSRKWMKYGCFAARRLPFVKSIGRNQASTPRKAARNAGFSASDSARALIIRLPIAASLAQLGISPQRNNTISRSFFSPAGLQSHDRHRLTGRNVIAGP